MLCFVDDVPKSCLQDQKAKILNLDFLWNGSNLEFSISCGQAGAAAGQQAGTHKMKYSLGTAQIQI